MVKVGILSVALALCAAAAPLPAQSALRVDLNIPENRLVVLQGDSVVRQYRVSVGLPGYDTPDGEFTIQRAEWNPWWRPPTHREWARDRQVTPPGPNNPMGRVKLFFEPLYYIHGTPDVEALGQPASRGCVRMLNADVIDLARLLHEHGEPTVRPSEIDGILARSGTTRNSTFRAPPALTIRYEPVVVRDGELKVFPDVYDRGRIHTEAVYQALLAAGYDAAAVDRAAIRDVLQRARAARGTFTVRIADAFGNLPRTGRRAE
jgi:murein L,D-transpeptidase YcbB/YkuD